MQALAPGPWRRGEVPVVREPLLISYSKYAHALRINTYVVPTFADCLSFASNELTPAQLILYNKIEDGTAPLGAGRSPRGA